MMEQAKAFLTSKYMLWLILALPAIGLTNGYLQGEAKYGMLMHVTGEFAGRFLIISLIATPLALLFPKGKLARWLIRNRRFFGVAAFAYTLLHTIFYVLEYSLSQVIDESLDLAILTGWIAFLVFIPLAVTSTDAAVKRMGASWKKLQRWVYLAAVMAFAHWALLGLQGEHASMGAALFHFVPVMLLQVVRVWKQRQSISQQHNT